MIKALFLLVGAMIASPALFSQKLIAVVNYVTDDGTHNTNNIYYEPNQLLTWNDFIGKPVDGSDASAMTNAGIGLKLAFHSVGNTSQLVISVNCNFSKKDSWVKPGNKTSYMLNHEQNHFHIAYIHACLFIQKLREAGFTNANYAAMIEKLYNETAMSMGKMQNQYDAETGHSLVKEKQTEWDEKISKQLALSLKL